MKTTYFKTIIQKTTNEHSILIAVIPNNMLGVELPSICEMQAFMMPKTIYTGTYPQIKINIDTLTDRSDLKGQGIAGIVAQPTWFTKVEESDDLMGISI
ncbi:hypothetical protein [Pedobacter zeae]|uniref:Uncharacterized protein n=1 Tax=Pedobacter zeae TaxID=1737356 RepID=A0A7W6K9K8_9SPHI|nr:hypothetical protein [Pedobacter zeae]MBB4107730.1 hypothetical protein [Pedobacter zeae]GGG97445.1 hypothetical protein GCM10007422_09240 [Pedobacter zeae]